MRKAKNIYQNVIINQENNTLDFEYIRIDADGIQSNTVSRSVEIVDIENIENIENFNIKDYLLSLHTDTDTDTDRSDEEVIYNGYQIKHPV